MSESLKFSAVKPDLYSFSKPTQHLQDFSDKSKSNISVSDIIAFSPEMKTITDNIKDYVKHFFFHLHDDSKLEEMTDFFKNFELDNPSVMFLLYMRVSTKFIQNQENFKKLEASFKRKAIDISKGSLNSLLLSDSIEKIIQRVIQSSYRGLPTLAIAKALDLEIGKVDLSNFKGDEEEKISIALEKQISSLFSERLKLDDSDDVKKKFSF